MKAVRSIWLFLTLTLAPLLVWGQFPGDRNPQGQIQRIPGVNDTSRTDSAPEIEIEPRTFFIDRGAIMRHRPYLVSPQWNVSAEHIWDSLDATPFFSYSLGQIGKHYRIFEDGFEQHWWPQPQWINPMTGHHNLHLINPATSVQYFDTRTPYVNVDYTLGDKNLQVADVTISRNISRLLNATVHVASPIMNGFYRNFETRDRRVWASTYFHSPGNRYFFFFNATYSQAENQYNGGVTRRDNGDYQVVDGIIRENPINYANAFLKEISQTNLSEARELITQKGLYFDQYYRLLGAGEAPKQHNLTLRSTLQYNFEDRLYTDDGINRSALAANLIPVYPTLDTGTSTLVDYYGFARLRGDASASYTWRGPFEFHVEALAGYERHNWRQLDSLQSQDLLHQVIKGELIIPRIRAGARLSQRISTIFAPEQRIQTYLDFSLLGGKPAFKWRKGEPDSTALAAAEGRDLRIQPLVLSARYERFNRNPSLFQTRFVTNEGSTFRPVDTLANERLDHFSVDLTLERPAGIIRNDTLLANYVSLRAFASLGRRIIHYDDSLRILQAAPGENLDFIGAELALRLRLVSRIYFEGIATYQIGQSQGGFWLQRYSQRLPQFFGKASLFLDTKRVRFGRLRVGFDVYYNSSYIGQTIDPYSGEFFPANYEVLGFVRTDLFASIQVWLATVHFKVTNLLDQIGVPGYYRTPFYPMTPRMINVGINWTFYD